jgi:N-methylhydantoinase B
MEVDPITLSTVWHSLQTTCREMRHQIERTAQSYLMGQLKDVSVGIWRADGATVAMPEGLLNQFLGTGLAISSILEKFGDDLYEGDVILTNDPYHGGHAVHLPDWGFIRPVFWEGELLFFTLCRGHQQDTGGSFPGGYFPNGYDIHAEGICIPPTKVFKEGVEQTDLLELVWNNVRFPEGVRQDNYSMMASLLLAEKRIHALLKRYGRDQVLDCIDEMIIRTERAVRAELASIPDGTYSGESATDDDGTVLDEPVWIRVDVTVKGDELIIDFSRSDGARKGYINSIYAATYGTAVGSAILLFDPALADYHNEGSLRPMTVIAPPGNVTNAQYPSTVGASPVNVGLQITEAVTQALAKAKPERAMGAWGKHRGDYTFASDPRTGKLYVRTTFDYDGSAGAVWGHDGPTGPTAMGTLASVVRGNVEEAEIRYPWRMLKLEVVPDFMGAGRWRGGGGVDWRAVNEGSDGRMATGSSDGDVMLGQGVVGGHPTPPCRTFLQRDGQLIHVKPHRMCEFKTGDILIKLSSGGAGVGPPAEREISKVVEDVRNGIVSVDCARDIYRVSVDPVSLEVDHELTAKLRAESNAPSFGVVVDSTQLKARLEPQ